jgi:uncharacterized damage-inducible protein DinB
MDLESVRTFVEYHVAVTRRVWDSIEQITDEQFVVDDTYSRGSIRNLMVHITSTDRRWLAGIRNESDVGHLGVDDYPDRASARAVFEQVANDLTGYVNALSHEDLAQNANDIPAPRWTVLFHLVNHGTDHRATVLQKLTELGAPAFNQDFILWLWDQK